VHARTTVYHEEPKMTKITKNVLYKTYFVSFVVLRAFVMIRC